MQNRLIIFLVSVNLLGGLIFGYNTGVIALTLGSISIEYELDTLLQGVLTTSILVGAFVGSATGIIADKIGRKKSVIILSAVSFGGAIFSMVSPVFWVLCIARAILGYGVGLATSVCPLYVGEMSSNKLRGRLGSLFELGLTLGIFISYIVCYLLLLRDPNDYIARDWNWYWRIAFGVGGVFGVVGVVIGIIMPESTFWIEKQKKNAVKNSDNNEHMSIKDNDAQDENKKGMQMWKEFFKPKNAKYVMLGVMLAVSYQLTGVNAITFYTPTILASTGLTDTNLFTLIIGAWNFLVTIPPIFFVDKYGRKPLMLVGLSIIVGGLVMIASSYYASDLFINGIVAMVGIGIFMIGFEAGPGILFWILVGEIFPNSMRDAAPSFVNAFEQLLIISLTLAFPSLVVAIGAANIFWIFAGVGVICTVYIGVMLSESNGSDIGQTELTSLATKIEIQRARMLLDI
jgi:sugar porter (SP) family MFS transporter